GTARRSSRATRTATRSSFARADSPATRASLHQQRRAPLRLPRRAGVRHDRAAARDALARRGRGAPLDPVDQELKGPVSVRLDESIAWNAALCRLNPEATYGSQVRSATGRAMRRVRSRKR